MDLSGAFCRACPLVAHLLAGACLLTVSTSLFAQGRPRQAPQVLVVESVTVVDAATGTLLPNRRIVIRGDSISTVEPITAAAPSDATRTVNGEGLFAIPGLVDHHVHLSAGMESTLERAVRGGVTLVQALAGDNRVAGYLAIAVQSGRLRGPEIAYASVMAGPEFFTDPRFINAGAGYAPGTSPWAQAVTAQTDLPLAVAAARGSGAEVLKLYAMMDADLVAALTHEAHRQGLRVVAHGTVFPARPSDLVAAGVDVLTHAPYLSWQGAATITANQAWDRRDGPYATVPPNGPAMTGLVQAMARAGTHLEPTLWVFNRAPADSLLQRWANVLIRAADAARVPILAGTDGLVDDDSTALPNIHKEMALLVASGLSPARALAAATIVPARLMGRGNTHGRVAAGRVADLVLLTANPLVDISATTRIRYVIRRGEILERSR
ncbi:MAG: amidohydrolase family protein [Gemmatimonadota bacterium]|nr:amidohydrolase family protein [Gemmatimonadota bacterium]